MTYRIARLLGLPLLHALFRIEVTGRRHIPKARNCIIIANHLNWLDSFAILAAFPPEPRVHFLGDPTILVTRRVQWFLLRHLGGFVPVDRNRHADVRLFEHVNRCLQRGGTVALYPEANYGPAEGQLLPFRKGFAHFALDNQIPVVPVGLCGTHQLWLRKRVRMAIGAPIPPAGHSVESLVVLGRTRVAELIPPYLEAPGPKLLRGTLTHLF